MDEEGVEVVKSCGSVVVVPEEGPVYTVDSSEKLEGTFALV